MVDLLTWDRQISLSQEGGGVSDESEEGEGGRRQGQRRQSSYGFLTFPAQGGGLTLWEPERTGDEARPWEPRRAGDGARPSSLGEQESAIAAREVCGGNIRISGKATPWEEDKSGRGK
jgi:hypothetical protein